VKTGLLRIGAGGKGIAGCVVPVRDLGPVGWSIVGRSRMIEAALESISGLPGNAAGLLLRFQK
jgi:hypothetical protein